MAKRITVKVVIGAGLLLQGSLFHAGVGSGQWGPVVFGTVHKVPVGYSVVGYVGRTSSLQL